MIPPLTSVCYVMRDYPVLSHATVHNEIRGLRRRGFPVRVFSLIEADRREWYDAPSEELPTATYCWQMRAPRANVAKANANTIARVGPGTYYKAYQLARRGGLVGNWPAYTRLVHHAQVLMGSGVSHFHAHWATEAATVALVLSWLTRLPFSFTAHAYDIFLSPQFLELKLKEASFAVTVSEYNRRHIVEHFGSQHLDKVHVIYPLVDLSQFSLRDPPAEYRPTILSVARLSEYKGLIHLVEACRTLRDRGKDFLCQIVGQGEDELMLRTAITRYRLEPYVQLLGALPHEAIPSLLNQATVFALPCVIAENGDRDGMPLVLIEAMARGVPVVSSDLIGLPELIRDGAGLLARPGDAVAVADALQTILDLPSPARRRMGEIGRQIVQQCDMSRGVTRLLELIQGA